MKRLAPMIAALAAAAAAVGLYAALGGGRYEPSPVADPCVAQAAGEGGGASAVIERVLLVTVDKAACKLGVSREALVLSLRDRQAFEKLAAENGISSDVAEKTVATSLKEGIDAAQKAGDLSGLVAGLVGGLVERTPPWLLLDLLDRLRALLT